MLTDNYWQEIVQRFADAVVGDAVVSKKFYAKWGIRPIEIRPRLTDIYFHGGVLSKVIAINNLEREHFLTGLNIGPETGIEVFLLLEVCDKVTVCDPDEDNLGLIESIVKNMGVIDSDRLVFIPAGFGNKLTSRKETENYNLIRKYNETSLPTYYNVSSVREVGELDLRTDLVFIHKIISTLSRNRLESPKQVFIESIMAAYGKLSTGGTMSWVEPAFFLQQNDIASGDLPYNPKVIDYSLPGLLDVFRQLIFYK